ncbi:MAG: alpha-glucan family phosphorylase [Gammaproteobacteria bacterium]|nr:alpha-glucan family phosphorylase [Gammaproteobacteria bacterium]
MKGTKFKLEIQPRIPEELKGLVILANDLFYSWDRAARGLYHRLDSQLWSDCSHNPKVFLRRLEQKVLDEAIEDHVFMEEYSRVISAYESYLTKGIHPKIGKYLDPEKDMVAYFCAEFGFHESCPIYSGGLGILAGDHCKAASDLGVPFVAVGLLYRQGYFLQTVDSSGKQMAHYNSTDFNDLPIKPAKDQAGNELHVQVNIAGRDVTLKVWQANAGHITLYLLDTDLEQNSESDRSITFQLYGGDIETRIQQEIVLGIGGVRALRALGINPNVWHINEGHAAFQILERCHEHVKQGLNFYSAIELVASGTVFTTHTPVAAGHDIFSEEQIAHHFSGYAKSLGISVDDFMKLGNTPTGHARFNMTAFALRGSRFHNGVSRIHGDVASRMESYIWPQVPYSENPMSYVTNGVHAQTFLAREWVNLFDMRFRAWRNELMNKKYWDCIDEIPAHRFWSLRQELKTQMLDSVYDRMLLQHRRNGCCEGLLNKITNYVSQSESDVLVLGFARRFATYKRATLIFSDLERLERLLGNPDRPVILIFAGKAHPSDVPGQELIRQIHEYSLRPEFLGKIIFLEGYDMGLARKLVTGVDVWLNTPEYPLEASGTSGQKAAINGVINLSVLDGWWGEGYNGKNGWAITPHSQVFDTTYRNTQESNELLDIMENKVIPLYFDRGNQGYSKDWVKISKESMKSCIPRFNSQRMVRDYVKNFYMPAKKCHSLMLENNMQAADELAKWKNKITANWHKVTASRIDNKLESIKQDETLPITVSVFLNGLLPEDVVVECIIGKELDDFSKNSRKYFSLNYVEKRGEEYIFSIDLNPAMSGLNYYRIRIYPQNKHLSRRFETGYMMWL